MTIVVDTNCLLAAVPKKSQYRWLYDAIVSEQVRLVVTTEIIAEYEEQLGLFYAPDYVEFILIALLNIPSLLRINPLSFYWLLITNDPDDSRCRHRCQCRLYCHKRQALPYTERHPFPFS